jgi:uncharacterized membrane protein YhhN
MKIIKKYGLAIFWVVLVLDCLLCIVNSHKDRIYTKPLLLPTLTAYFFVNTKRSKHFNTKSLIYLGLTIAWVCDWLLLQNDIQYNTNSLFLFIGISCLLTAFLIFGLIFKKMKGIDIKDCQEAFLSAFAMSIASILFYNVLRTMPLGNFKYLIIVGMIIMTTVMALAANVHRDKIKKSMSYSFFIPGTLILIISISILIAHKFILPDATFLPAVILLTYGFGMMLMMRGFTKYLKV